MALKLIIRSSILLLLLTLSANLFAQTEKWSEDALLHDGRIIKVNREVSYTTSFSRDSFLKSWPDKFSFEFEHPDTKKNIKWWGEQYFEPVLLDIVDGVPYLVVYGQPDKKTEKIYGCPELPYIFLKYEKGFFGKWVVVPVEQFPVILQDANLSPGFSHYTKVRRELARDNVLVNIRDVELSSGGSFQAKIPRNYDTWYSMYKDSHRNDRKWNDCRPPRQPLPKINLLPPQDVVLEILATRDYLPEKVMDSKEWNRLWFDTNRQPHCNGLFKPADPDDRLMGEVFIKDPSKRRPYSNSMDRGAHMICDVDYFWFISHLEEPNKIVLTKYTVFGDMLYRIKFTMPEYIKPYTHYIHSPSFHSKDGYLYFEWWDFRDSARMWYIRRTQEVRLPEPKANVISAAIEQSTAQASDSDKDKVKLVQAAPQLAMKSFRDCPTCPEMIVIPGKNYAIGKYEVTQAEWTAIMNEALAVDGKDKAPDKPMIYRDWEYVQQYIGRLNKLTGKNYRLPTEAEWEYACYAGSQTEYCGSNNIDDVAWYKKIREYAPHPVGQKQPNGYGLYDMSGNVWEWMDDCWKNNCKLRVLRGASYLNHPLSVRAAYIYGMANGEGDVGFRLARTLQ